MARKKKGLIERDGTAPNELLAALAALHETNGDAIVDSLSNDTANAFRATVKAVSECREVLDAIEAFASKHLEKEFAYHRQYLDEIEALNVLPPTMRAVA